MTMKAKQSHGKTYMQRPEGKLCYGYLNIELEMNPLVPADLVQYGSLGFVKMPQAPTAIDAALVDIVLSADTEVSGLLKIRR